MQKAERGHSKNISRVRRNADSWWMFERRNPRDVPWGLERKFTTRTGAGVRFVTFSHGWPLNADAWGGQMQREQPDVLVRPQGRPRHDEIGTLTPRHLD